MPSTLGKIGNVTVPAAGGGGGATILVDVGDAQTLISNGDANNIIYIGSYSGINPTNTPNDVVPLQPGASMVIDCSGPDSSPVYGICSPGQTAICYTIPGGISFFLLSLLEAIVFSKLDQGIFTYGTNPPTFGSLITSDAPFAGTDNEGDAYLSGFAAYGPITGGFAAVNMSAANQLSWWTSPTMAGPWVENQSIQADINGDLVISASNRIGFNTVIVPFIGASFETWHTLGGYGATGYTILQNRFRLTVEGDTKIDIQLQAGAGGGTAGVYTATITLPSSPNYQFAGNYSRSYPFGYNGTIAAGQNFGSVLVDGAGTGTPGRVRIDIPGLPANTVIGCTIIIPAS